MRNRLRQTLAASSAGPAERWSSAPGAASSKGPGTERAAIQILLAPFPESVEPGALDRWLDVWHTQELPAVGGCFEPDKAASRTPPDTEACRPPGWCQLR